ncbi:MAG: histidine kinase [Reichenbachiella sp.]
MTNKNIKELAGYYLDVWWMRWFIVPFLGGTMIAVLSCIECISEERISELYVHIFTSFMFWTLLANGCREIISYIIKRWSWVDEPVKTFIISLTSLVVFTTVASLLIVHVYAMVRFDKDVFQVIRTQGIYSLLKIPLAITLSINVFMHGRAFLMQLKKEIRYVAQLENENLTAKFESLKNQVNPHFLFNSLNALTSLVYADQNKAVDFIHKLSDVYRYVLDHQYDELVELKTELALVKSFVFLNQIRFGENLEVEFSDLDKLKGGEKLPPLTLQMLIENCLKHNEISKNHPLKVKLKLDDNRLQVTNNINPLSRAKEDSNKLGLNNIIARYEFLTKEKVMVENKENQFLVNIPLIISAQT